MRTNIVLDEALVKEGLKLGRVTTMRELVDIALHEFVENRKRLNLRDLKGAGGLRDDYDYKAMRAGTPKA